MEAPGGDADFRAEAELAAIGELGGGVVDDDGAVHRVQERLRRLGVGGDDRVGMVGAVGLDVRHRLRQVGDGADGNDGVQVFGVPVGGGGGQDAGIQRRHLGVAAHLAARADQGVEHAGQVAFQDRAVDQHGFRRAADAGAPHLGVQRHGARHLRVGGGMDIGVVDAVQVLEHRDAAFRRDPFDQPLAAARHDHVHEFRHGQQQADGGAVGGGNGLDRRFRQPGGGDSGGQGGVDRRDRAEAFRPAAQDRRVARLQAQGSGVGGDVGAAFEDDADDPERHRDAFDVQAVGAVPARQGASHRVGQGGHLFQPGGHRLDPLRGEAQAVQHRAGESLGLGIRHVRRVGGGDGGGGGADGGGGGGQRGVLGRGVGQRQLRGGGAGGLPDRPHGGGKIVLGGGHRRLRVRLSGDARWRGG